MNNRTLIFQSIPNKEIKEELEDSIANGNKNKNTDIEQMAKNCTESEEDAAEVIHKLEEIIRNKKK